MARKFYDEFEFFEDSEEMSCPWYIRARMDADTVHMYVSDLYSSSDDCFVFEEETESEFKKVSLDTVLYLLSPSYLRSQGNDPGNIWNFDSFRKRSIALLFSFNKSQNLGLEDPGFAKRFWDYVNGMISLLWNSNSLEEGKSYVKDLLSLFALDVFTGYIDNDEFALYFTSYPVYIKVLYYVGYYTDNDIESLRYEHVKASAYLKSVPSPTGWDFKNFLEAEANFIASAFYRSFILSKRDPCDNKWLCLHNDADSHLSIVENLLGKISTVSIKNKQKEIWELSLPDLFYSVIRKKLMIWAEEIPQGSLREEFTSFHLPEEVQKILNSRATYRPWKKIK